MAKAELLIKKFKRVKTLPHIVTRLAQLINDKDSTLQDFEEVIRLDPTLVARLLTLVNSSYFGIVRKVDSISRAMALLGMKNLHNIAVTDALKGMLLEKSSTGEFSHDRLWLHSAASGICGKMISERIFSINGDDAYLCGILHDIGLIVEIHGAKEDFLKAFNALEADGPSIIELENDYIGTDHCRIGYLLTREWQIPEPLAEAIRDHHTILDSIVPDSPAGILQMSEYILSQLDFNVKEDIPVALTPSLTAHIQQNVAEYKVLAEDLPEEIDKVREMYGD